MKDLRNILPEYYLHTPMAERDTIISFVYWPKQSLKPIVPTVAINISCEKCSEGLTALATLVDPAFPKKKGVFCLQCTRDMKY